MAFKMTPAIPIVIFLTSTSNSFSAFSIRIFRAAVALSKSLIMPLYMPRAGTEITLSLEPDLLFTSAAIQNLVVQSQLRRYFIQN